MAGTTHTHALRWRCYRDSNQTASVRAAGRLQVTLIPGKTLLMTFNYMVSNSEQVRPSRMEAFYRSLVQYLAVQLYSCDVPW